MNPFSWLESMLDTVIPHLESDGIDVSELFLDHVCYRVETLEEYREMKEQFSQIGKILKEEKMIGWRPIATYKLDIPIEYKWRKIPCVEIPAPKEWSPYPTWWEHAEFVVDMPLLDWIEKYSHLAWKTDGMHKAINPEVAINYWNYSVKFHNHPLEYVIMELE